MGETPAPERIRGMLSSLNGRFKPDLVVSIARGGTPFGVAIARALSVPHYSFRMKVQPKKSGIKGWLSHRERRIIQPLVPSLDPGKRILLVDDNAHSGLSLKVAVMHLTEKGASPQNIQTMVYRSSTRAQPNFAVVRQNFLSSWLYRRKRKKQRQMEKKRGLK